MSENGRKWTGNRPKISQKRGCKWTKMAENDQKRPKNGRKWAQMGQKMRENWPEMAENGQK